MDNYDNLITDIFKNDIQVKRITKELQMLKELQKDDYKLTLQNSSGGLNIMVELTPNLLLKHQLEKLNQGRPITFLIRLDSKFPFAFPRIHSLNQITTNPSLSDGRDFIEDIIQKPWSPSVLLCEIILTLPTFLRTIKDNLNDRPYLLEIGRFHQDQEYNIIDQALFEDIQIFQCKDLQDGNKSQKKLLQVSKGFIVLFDVQDKSKNIVTLSSYQTLNRLINIRRKQKTDDTIVLTWKDNTIKDGKMQVLSVQNCDACVDSIIKNMRLSGVKVSKNHSKVNIIPESEVTIEQFQLMNVQLILDDIRIYERELEEELTFPVVNKLMDAYQKVIEYYSALEEKQYEEYVTKLKGLLLREDIQDLLDLQYKSKRQNDVKEQFQEK